MKVRAIRPGYYGYYRAVGDSFEIADKAQFSKAWMEPVEDEAKAKPKPAKPEPKQ